jgi:hypothetical protein
MLKTTQKISTVVEKKLIPVTYHIQKWNWSINFVLKWKLHLTYNQVTIQNEKSHHTRRDN